MLNRDTTLLERLARVIQNEAHHAGLKPTQWEALRYLARANRFSRSPGALTAYLGMTKGTVSQTLQALERKGLVEKKTAPTDRRGVAIDLTPAGTALLGEDPLAATQDAVDHLPAKDREALTGALEKLLKTMLEKRGGRPFGACRTCLHFRRDHTEGSPHFCALLAESLSEDDSTRICSEQQAA